MFESGGSRYALELVGRNARLCYESSRNIWTWSVPQHFTADYGVSVFSNSENDHAGTYERTGGDAAKNDEVHDDVHGHHVLQSRERAMPVFHRFEFVGHRRAKAVAEAASGRRRSRWQLFNWQRQIVQWPWLEFQFERPLGIKESGPSGQEEVML